MTPRKDHTQLHITIYVITSIVLVIGAFFARSSLWTGNTLLHTNMEVAATLLALIIGAMALVNFYTTRSVTFLYIGVGFLGTGFLDGFHAVVTSPWFANTFPSPPPSLVPWSWIASRLFLSFSMFLSWYAWHREKEEHKGIIAAPSVVYTFFALLTLGLFALFVFVPMPRAYYPELITARPEEFVPALFFLLALVGYLVKQMWRYDAFEHWLVLSLIVGFLGQTVFMSFSTHLFDAEFDLAHLLKKASYIMVLIGLLVGMFKVFIREQTSRLQFARQAEDLKKETSAREAAFKKLVSNESALQKSVTELAETRDTMLNVLKDLEAEKKKLVAKEAELVAAQKMAKFGNFSWSLKENRSIWSEEVYRIHGLKPDESAVAPTIDEYMSKIVHPDDRAQVMEGYKTLTSASGKNENVFRIIWPNGSVHFVRTVAEITLDETGKLTMMRGTFQDITAEREVDQAKTEFVSLASHQLRTPLSTINWYSEMLLAGDAGKLNDEQKQFLEEIYAGSQRMVELVNALLNVSRLELGTFAVDPEPTDVVALARSVMDEQKPQIDERELKITPKFGKNIPVMQVDPKLLRMVFQNLLSNSVKYTPIGGSITFAIEADTKRKLLAIQVADSGMGIPESEQAKMFSKLYRATNVREQDTEGTGLGLYIVKAVVEQSGGKIWFESKENEGTTFYITLPLTGMELKEGTKGLE